MNNNNNITKNELFNEYYTLKISDLDSVITQNKTVPIKPTKPGSIIRSSKTLYIPPLGNAITTTTITRRKALSGVQKREKVITAVTFGEDFRMKPRKEQSPSAASNLVVLTNDQNPIKKLIPVTNIPSSTASNLVVLTNDQKSIKNLKHVVVPVINTSRHQPLLIKEKPTDQQSTGSRSTNPYQQIRRELPSVINQQNANLNILNPTPNVTVPMFNPPNLPQNQFDSQIGPQIPKNMNYHRYNESYIPASPIPNRTRSPNEIYHKSYPDDARFNQDSPRKDVYRIPPPQCRYERKSPLHETRSRAPSEIIDRDLYRYGDDFRRDKFGTEHRERSRSPVDSFRYHTESRYRRIILSPDRESFRRRSYSPDYRHGNITSYDVSSRRRSRSPSYSRDRIDVDSGYDKSIRRNSPHQSPTYNYRRHSRSPIDRFDKYYDSITSSNTKSRRSPSNRDRYSKSPLSWHNRRSRSKNRTDTDKYSQKESTVARNSPNSRNRSLNNPRGEDRQGTQLNSTKSYTKANRKIIEEFSGNYKNTTIPDVIDKSTDSFLGTEMKVEMISDEELDDDKEESTEQEINIKDIVLSRKFAGVTKCQQSTGSRTATLPIDHKTEESTSKSTDIKVIIVPNDFPIIALTEEQIDSIQISLIDHIKPGEQGTGPQFEGIQLEEGTMVVACKNLESKIWLEGTIPKLRGDGAKLRTITRDELASNKIKFNIQLLHPMPGKSPRNVLDLIKAQNVGLNTDTWRIVDSTETPQGMNIIVYVDKASIKGLQKCKMNPCLGLHRAICEIIRDDETK